MCGLFLFRQQFILLVGLTWFYGQRLRTVQLFLNLSKISLADFWKSGPSTHLSESLFQIHYMDVTLFWSSSHLIPFPTFSTQFFTQDQVTTVLFRLLGKSPEKFSGILCGNSWEFSTRVWRILYKTSSTRIIWQIFPFCASRHWPI